MRSSAAITLPAPASLAQSLATKVPGFVAIDWVEEVSSTNTSLLSLARAQGLQAGWPRLLGAHHQTQGKGRLGRTWLDVPGQTLMFSAGFMLPAGQSLANLMGLGPAVGMASVLALRPMLAEPARLRVKWPNDLMLDDGKCAGILIELVVKANTKFVVIGMGLNLSGNDRLSNELHRKVAVIAPNLRPGTTACSLVAGLASSWQQTLSQVNSTGFASCQADYVELDYLAGQAVTIVDQGHTISAGIASGLGPDGSLQVQTAQGIETFHAGDVSVRLNSTNSQTNQT